MDIYNYPHTIPSADLFNPTMVTINVVQDSEKATFTIPRALICAKSAYFQKAFQGNLVEAETREIYLEDDGIATHNAFKIFVTWLYTGLIYLESNVVIADGVTTSDEQQQREMLMDDDVAVTHDPEPAVERATLHGKRKGDVGGKTSCDSLAKKTKLGTQPNVDDSGTPEASWRTLATAHSEHSSEDLVHPYTWSWLQLFELCVFADKYDTKALRQQIMEMIRFKKDFGPDLFAESVPGFEAMRYAAENLTRASPLYRFATDALATGLYLSETTFDIATRLNDLPKDFLVDSLLASKRHMEADDRCGVDMGEGTGDNFPFDNKHACRYHEHGKDAEERQRCERRWDHFWMTCGAWNSQKTANRRQRWHVKDRLTNEAVYAFFERSGNEGY